MPQKRSTPPRTTPAPEQVVDSVAHWAGRLETALDPRHAAEELLGPLASSVGATRASVMLVNRDTGRLQVIAGLGLSKAYLGQDVPVAPRSISYWVLRARQAVILHGEVHDERFDGSAATARIASAMCVPLPGVPGVTGVLNLARTAPADTFKAQDLLVVESVTAAISAILERVRELGGARQLSRQLAQRPAPEPWPVLQGGEVAMARLEGLAGPPNVCERLVLGDGTLFILLAEPLGEPGRALRVSEWLRGMFHAGAARAVTPGAFAQELHQRMLAHQPGGAARAWLGTLAPDGQMRSCAAGYLAPIFVPAEGEPGQRLSEGGPALGTVGGPIAYQDTLLRLLAGDALVVVSDAVLTSSSIAGAEFGLAGAVARLLEHRRRPLEEVVQNLLTAAQTHSALGVAPGEMVVLALRQSRPG